MNQFLSKPRIDSVMATLMLVVLPAFLAYGMYDMNTRPTPGAALQIAKASQAKVMTRLASVNKAKVA